MLALFSTSARAHSLPLTARNPHTNQPRSDTEHVQEAARERVTAVRDHPEKQPTPLISTRTAHGRPGGRISKRVETKGGERERGCMRKGGGRINSATIHSLPFIHSPNPPTQDAWPRAGVKLKKCFQTNEHNHAALFGSPPTSLLSLPSCPGTSLILSR
jgi:hypothetical protein